MTINTLAAPHLLNRLPDDLYYGIVRECGLSAWNLRSANKDCRDRTDQAIHNLEGRLFHHLDSPPVPIAEFYSRNIKDIKKLDPGTDYHEKMRIFDPTLYLAIDQKIRELADPSLVHLFACIRHLLPEETSTFSDANKIREWMYDHQEVLDEIKTLDLANFIISILPPELNLLRNLTYLDLSHTDVTALPKGFNPPFLEKLFLEKTPLSTFPDGFNPPNLKVLHLCSSSSFTFFPKGFNPPLLEWLDLTDTSFAAFPDDFDMSMLRKLYLTNTPIETISDNHHFNDLEIYKVPLPQIWRSAA
jgi:Leucine-rich repeat (LRR) protein